MESPVILQFKYDGPALQSGDMNVRDLASALLAMSDIIEKANRTLVGDETEVSINIHSVERGSFTVELSVIQSLYKQAIKFFSSNTVNAFINISIVVGGLFKLVKVAKGRLPKRILPLDSKANEVRIEFEEGDSFVVRKESVELFRDLEIRTKTFEVIKPLEREGVEEFVLEPQKKESIKVGKEEIIYFIPPIPGEEQLGENETEQTFSIVSLSFKEDNKWRLSDGVNVYNVKFLDEDFQRRIQRGIGFTKHDLLKVKLRTRQWRNMTGLKTEYEVLKVIEHIKPLQLNIPFEPEKGPDETI